MPNALQSERSLYLRQHANNPVLWFPWGHEAWHHARERDCLVIVSIGYSACHWCHVMEHESFEDNEVAQVMNDGFVSIKVDREERPDVDLVYMDAALLISGRGGWPLNAICLPDGQVLYAGTYFPKQHWLQLLRYFRDYYLNHRQEAIENAQRITEGVQQMEQLQWQREDSVVRLPINVLAEKLVAGCDTQHGGRPGAPKFMMPTVISWLLQQGALTGLKAASEAAMLQLNEMLRRGIYDQVGGGFFRYSVDDHWEIPHFEKMLYDNAQLISVYVEAFQIHQQESFKNVAIGVGDFLLAEMYNGKGGFYSAIDADSSGKEGAFYVWRVDELQQIIEEDWLAFRNLYQISEEGNFEGFIHLNRVEGPEHPNEKKWLAKLLQVRNNRARPSTDEKQICAWNGMAITALSKLFGISANEPYRSAAIATAQRFLGNWRGTKLLNRCFHGNEAHGHAFLDDYAFLIQGLLQLYVVTFHEEWLQSAKDLCIEAIDLFYDEGEQVFFYTAKGSDALLVRKTEIQDNVIPSSNAVMAENLIRLHAYFPNHHFEAFADGMLKKAEPAIRQHPYFHACWGRIIGLRQQGINQLVGTGNLAFDALSGLNSYYLPNLQTGLATAFSNIPLFEGKYHATQTLFFWCGEGSCLAPVSSLDETPVHNIKAGLGRQN
ncbi:MAG: thioredoxin domain-containing protein [Chitinophagales bacterium]